MIRETINTYVEWMSKHWVLITTIATISTYFVGVVTSSIYYSAFGVNYTELADLNEHLRNAISKPYLGLFLLMTLILAPLGAYLMFNPDISKLKIEKFFTSQKLVKSIKFKAKYRNRNHKISFMGILCLVTLAYLTLVISDLELKNLRKTQLVMFNVDTDTKPLTCVVFLGRISNYHIFRDINAKKKPIIIPLSSIKRMTYAISLENIPAEFVADNQVKSSEYIQWENNFKKICNDKL